MSTKALLPQSLAIEIGRLLFQQFAMLDLGLILHGSFLACSVGVDGETVLPVSHNLFFAMLVLWLVGSLLLLVSALFIFVGRDVVVIIHQDRVGVGPILACCCASLVTLFGSANLKVCQPPLADGYDGRTKRRSITGATEQVEAEGFHPKEEDVVGITIPKTDVIVHVRL